METVRTLLRTPELVRALEPLLSVPVAPKDIFRLIGEGRIRPCGYIQRVPVFDIAQLADIARAFQRDGGESYMAAQSTISHRSKRAKENADDEQRLHKTDSL